MVGGAGVNDSVVSEGSEVAMLVKVNPGSALSLMLVTSWVSALGRGQQLGSVSGLGFTYHSHSSRGSSRPGGNATSRARG